MPCEDFPCCGHESGCCPTFGPDGVQTDMVCICGARLPVNNRSSICDSCLRDPEDDGIFTDEVDDWEGAFEFEDFDDEDEYDDPLDRPDQSLWDADDDGFCGCDECCPPPS